MNTPSMPKPSMRKPSLRHRLEAAGFDALMAWYGAKPLDQASAAGAGLGRLLGPRLGAHQTALNNLALAFPDWDARERARLAMAMWAQIGANVGEFAHMAQLRPGADAGRTEIIGGQRLDAVKQSGRGAVFVSGHFANWEVMAAAIVQRGIICHVGHRPPNNPLIEARIAAVRRGYGVTHQAPKGRSGAIQLMRALAKGESVALLNDQKYGEGLCVPLFGHEAMTSDAAIRLALRFEAPVIPMHVVRLGGAYFQVHVHEALPLLNGTDDEHAVRDGVLQINAFIEACVRQAPEQWFWVHRRWPKTAWDSLGGR